MRWKPAAIVVLVSAIATTCSGDGDANRQSTTTDRPADLRLGDDPQLIDRPCAGLPSDLPVPVRCHWLEVPEDRRGSAPDTIRLSVAVIAGGSADAPADPIVYIEGGPGYPSVENAPNFVDDAQRLGRDLVLFDQRGTGMSEPSLECPEREEAVVRNLGRAQPPEMELEDFRRSVVACQERLIREGVELDRYDTDASVADIEDLRVALGAESWNLWGASYGARLAMASVRSFPRAVRSLVLDSVYPARAATVEGVLRSARGAVDALVDGCVRDTTCVSAQPDLANTIRTVVRRYDETPFEGTVDAGEPFGTVPIVITGEDIYAGLTFALRDTSLIGQLPSIAMALAAGDTGIIPVLAAQAIPFANAQAEGAYYAIECADIAALGNAHSGPVEDPGDGAGLVPYQSDALCPEWEAEPTEGGPEATAPHEFPVLVLAGSYDPITPPSYSRDAAEAFDQSTYVELDGYGHVVSFVPGCAESLVAAFVRRPASPPESSCAEAVQPTF